MKSRLRSLKGWFSGGSRRRTRKNSAPRRRLLLESLESRRLLTADLAAIAGTVFVDLTDDGLTADDTRLEGITVNLYRDGGDQQFEGDTTWVDRVLTDSAGNYRFDQLTEGLYFVEQEAVDGLLQRPEETVRSVEITAEDAEGIRDVSIDSFGVTAQSVRVSSPAPATESVGGPAPEAVGGYRNMFIELESGSAVEMRVMDLDPPFFSFNSFAGALGGGVVTWDGGGAADQLDPTGLGGYDLTQDGTRFGIHFLQGADHAGGTIHLHVYTDGDNFSTFTRAIPETEGGEAVVATEIWFGDFETAAGQGADFENVGAIQMEIEGVVAMDAQIKDLGTLGPTIKTAHFANLNPLSLGDTVWFDANNNGFLDPDEIGIPGVELTLYEDTDGSGDFTPGVDVPLANQTTNGDGLYLFTDLFPGNYLVQVDPANFEPGGALHEMVSSTAFETPPDPNDNVDGDDNGYPREGQGVVSLAINLSAGGEPADLDNDPNTNRTLDFGFTRLADLELVKSDHPDPVSAGAELTYTLEVTNHGPSPADNVRLTDPLPDGVTFQSVTATQGNAEFVAGEVRAELGELPVGETATVTFVVIVDAGYTGNLENTATVTSDTPDPVLENNQDTEETVVEQTVNLTIEKQGAPEPVVAGTELVYTLLVTNQGPSDATGVTVVDTLPAEVTYLSATTSQGEVTHDDGVVTANLGDMAAGAEAELTITVLVAPWARGELRNEAHVSANEEETDLSDNTDTAIIPMIAEIDLAITKQDDPDPVVAGNQLVYTLAIENLGPSDATGVTVTDELPSGVVFVESSRPGATEYADGTLTLALGDLPVGESTTVEITVDVDPAARGTLVNTATVAGNEHDPVQENDQATVNTQVRAEIDLEISKTGAPNPVDAGGMLEYTLFVTNLGPSQATGVTVTDVLPEGLTYTSGTTTQGTVGETNGTITAVLGTLAPGDSATIVLTTTVGDSVLGQIVNTAEVAGQETELDHSNNIAKKTIQVDPRVDVAVTKTDSPSPVVAGENLTYTLTVTNSGPSQATGVQVVDELPAGLSFVSGNTTQGTLGHAAGVVTVNMGNLDSGASETITITTQVDPGARGTLENWAEVTANEPDSNLANNTDRALTEIMAEADLGITKTGAPAPVPSGEQLTYTLTVTNLGPSDATGVMVEDVLPAEVDYVTATTGQGTVTHAAGVVRVDLGDLAAGASQTIEIVTQVQAGFAGMLNNRAEVSGNEPDPNPANDSASETTPVQAQASSLSGYVYVDTNNDGIMQPDEPRLSGVTIRLSGTARDGTSIQQTATTDAQGVFRFNDLPAGNYNLVQEPPAGYLKGRETPGTAPVAEVRDNEFVGIDLGPGVDAENFLFGHRAPVFSKRLFLSSRHH